MRIAVCISNKRKKKPQNYKYYKNRDYVYNHVVYGSVKIFPERGNALSFKRLGRDVIYYCASERRGQFCVVNYIS